MRFEFTVIGKPVSWKNNPKVGRNKYTGKVFVTKPKEKLDWLDDAVLQLRNQYRLQGGREPIPRDLEVNAAIVSYCAKNQWRKIDTDNLYGGPHDALEAAGVLIDDWQIRSHNGSDRRLDDKNPRVEIVLTDWLSNGTPVAR